MTEDDVHSDTSHVIGSDDKQLVLSQRPSMSVIVIDRSGSQRVLSPDGEEEEEQDPRHMKPPNGKASRYQKGMKDQKETYGDKKGSQKPHYSKVEMTHNQYSFSQKKYSQPVHSPPSVSLQSLPIQQSDCEVTKRVGMGSRETVKKMNSAFEQPGFFISNSGLSQNHSGQQPGGAHHEGRISSKVGTNSYPQDQMAQILRTPVDKTGNKITDDLHDMHSIDSGQFAHTQMVNTLKRQTTEKRSNVMYKGSELGGQTAYLDATQISGNNQDASTHEKQDKYQLSPVSPLHMQQVASSDGSTDDFNEAAEFIRNQSQLNMLYQQMLLEGRYATDRVNFDGNHGILKGRNMVFKADDKDQTIKKRDAPVGKAAWRQGLQKIGVRGDATGMLYAMHNSSCISLSSPQAARDFQMLKYPKTATNLAAKEPMVNMLTDPRQLLIRTRGGATQQISDNEIRDKLSLAQHAAGVADVRDKGLIQKNPFIIKGVKSRADALKQAKEGLESVGLLKFTRFAAQQQDEPDRTMLNSYIQNLQEQLKPKTAVEVRQTRKPVLISSPTNQATSLNSDILQETEGENDDVHDSSQKPLRINCYKMSPMEKRYETNQLQQRVGSMQGTLKIPTVQSHQKEREQVTEDQNGSNGGSGTTSAVFLLSKAQLLEQKICQDKQQSTKNLCPLSSIDMSVQKYNGTASAQMLSNPIIDQQKAIIGGSKTLKQVATASQRHTIDFQQQQQIEQAEEGDVIFNHANSAEVNKPAAALQQPSGVRTQIVTRNQSANNRLQKVNQMQTNWGNLISSRKSIRQSQEKSQDSSPKKYKPTRIRASATHQYAQWYRLNNDLTGSYNANAVLFDNERIGVTGGAATALGMQPKKKPQSILKHHTKKREQVSVAEIGKQMSGGAQTRNSRVSQTSTNIHGRALSHRRKLTGGGGQQAAGINVLTAAAKTLKSQTALSQLMQLDGKEIMGPDTVTNLDIHSTNMNSDVLSDVQIIAVTEDDTYRDGTKMPHQPHVTFKITTQSQPQLSVRTGGIINEKQRAKTSRRSFMKTNRQAFIALHGQEKPHKLVAAAHHTRTRELLSLSPSMIKTTTKNFGNTTEFNYTGDTTGLLVANSGMQQLLFASPGGRPMTANVQGITQRLPSHTVRISTQGTAGVRTLHGGTQSSVTGITTNYNTLTGSTKSLGRPVSGGYRSRVKSGTFQQQMHLNSQKNSNLGYNSSHMYSQGLDQQHQQYQQQPILFPVDQLNSQLIHALSQSSGGIGPQNNLISTNSAFIPIQSQFAAQDVQGQVYSLRSSTNNNDLEVLLKNERSPAMNTDRFGSSFCPEENLTQRYQQVYHIPKTSTEPNTVAQIIGNPNHVTHETQVSSNNIGAVMKQTWLDLQKGLENQHSGQSENVGDKQTQSVSMTQLGTQVRKSMIETDTGGNKIFHFDQQLPNNQDFSRNTKTPASNDQPANGSSSAREPNSSTKQRQSTQRSHKLLVHLSNMPPDLDLVSGLQLGPLQKSAYDEKDTTVIPELVMPNNNHATRKTHSAMMATSDHSHSVQTETRTDAAHLVMIKNRFKQSSGSKDTNQINNSANLIASKDYQHVNISPGGSPCKRSRHNIVLSNPKHQSKRLQSMASTEKVPCPDTSEPDQNSALVQITDAIVQFNTNQPAIAKELRDMEKDVLMSEREHIKTANLFQMNGDMLNVIKKGKTQESVEHSQHDEKKPERKFKAVSPAGGKVRFSTGTRPATGKSKHSIHHTSLTAAMKKSKASIDNGGKTPQLAVVAKKLTSRGPSELKS